MSEVSRPYQPELLKALRDPCEAAEYLNAAIEDGSDEVFQLALQNVMEAQGLLWSGEEPHMARLATALEGVGLKLAFEVKQSAA